MLNAICNLKETVKKNISTFFSDYNDQEIIDYQHPIVVVTESGSEYTIKQGSIKRGNPRKIGSCMDYEYTTYFEIKNVRIGEKMKIQFSQYGEIITTSRITSITPL